MNVLIKLLNYYSQDDVDYYFRKKIILQKATISKIASHEMFKDFLIYKSSIRVQWTGTMHIVYVVVIVDAII